MTCLEAQSNIMAFIDKKLPDERIGEFVHHMRYCPNCMEELEIYYTLIVGMRQLDNNDELSHDFKEQLNNELDRLENKVKNAKRAKVSTFSVVLVFAVILMFLFYNQCLSKVYNIEQIIIKDKQGTEYFYNCFGDYIEICDEDIVVSSSLNNIPRESSFYEKIRFYNLMHPEIIEEDEEENENEQTVID